MAKNNSQNSNSTGNNSAGKPGNKETSVNKGSYKNKSYDSSYDYISGDSESSSSSHTFDEDF